MRDVVSGLRGFPRCALRHLIDRFVWLYDFCSVIVSEMSERGAKRLCIRLTNDAEGKSLWMKEKKSHAPSSLEIKVSCMSMQQRDYSL